MALLICLEFKIFSCESIIWVISKEVVKFLLLSINLGSKKIRFYVKAILECVVVAENIGACFLRS